MEITQEIIAALARAAGLKPTESNSPRFLPPDAEAASKILTEASRIGAPIHLAGGETNLPAPPDRIVLSSSENCQVRHLSRQDLTLEVGAGMTLKELNRHASSYDWQIPPSLGTIGGCLAAENDSPAKSELLPRIMGLVWIQPSGEILKLGGRTVKDVAGYRIFPLLFGSAGKLGMIWEVIVNLSAFYRDSTILPSVPSDESGNLRHQEWIENLLKSLDPARILG